MKWYVLDTNAIIRFPQFLAISDPNIQIQILSEVLAELQARSQKSLKSLSKEILNLIETRQFGSSVKVTEDLNFVGVNAFEPVEGVFSLTDKKLIVIGKRLKEAHPLDEVSVVTDDGEVLDTLKYLKNGVHGIRAVEFKKTLDQLSSFDANVSKKTSKIVTNSRKRFFVELLISVIGASVPAYLQIYRQEISAIQIDFNIIEKISFVMFTAMALLLYGWRFKWRWSYGLTEFVVGIVVACTFFDLSKITNIENEIKVVGGLFLCVRGLDNFHHGINKSELINLIPRLKISG